MSTNLLEHRIAMDLDPEFSKSDSHKARSLLCRLRRLQHLADNDRANNFTEGERAALLWALRELGVICGVLLEERHGANLRCVRPTEHAGDCDGRLGRDG